MELGDTNYAFRWLQAGLVDATTSKRRFQTLEEVKGICDSLNRAWIGQLVHWPVKYEAQMGNKGKPNWVQVEEYQGG